MTEKWRTVENCTKSARPSVPHHHLFSRPFAVTSPNPTRQGFSPFFLAYMYFLLSLGRCEGPLYAMLTFLSFGFVDDAQKLDVSSACCFAAVSSHVFAFAAIIRSHCVVASFSFFLATINPAYKYNEGISFTSRHKLTFSHNTRAIQTCSLRQ